MKMVMRFLYTGTCICKQWKNFRVGYQARDGGDVSGRCEIQTFRGVANTQTRQCNSVNQHLKKCPRLIRNIAETSNFQSANPHDAGFQ